MIFSILNWKILVVTSTLIIPLNMTTHAYIPPIRYIFTDNRFDF